MLNRPLSLVALCLTLNLTTFGQTTTNIQQDTSNNLNGLISDASAQSVVGDGHWVVSSFIGANMGSMFQGYGEGKKRTSHPSVSFAFDRRLNKGVLDIGFFIGTSKAELFLKDASRSTGLTTFVKEDVTITGWRTVLGARMMFHYDESEKSDVYSGVRAGIKHISRKTDTGRYNYQAYSAWFDWRLDEIEKQQTRPSIQIILFGYRRFVSENLAIGTEIAFGAPYYAALQVSYRVPLKQVE